jgi:hypothetical protein
LTGDFSGYVVDWIDRAADHGFRLTLYDGLLELPLVAGGPHMPDEPPLHWQIDVTETAIQVRGDGVLYIDAPKLTISGGGHFGFWAWGQGQNVAIDNLVAEDAPFQAHFRREPAAPFAGAPVTLNALSSSVATGVEVAAYDWDFGDGATGTGPIVSHVYGVPGDPLVTLTVTDRLGRRSTYQEHFRVHQPLVPFTDCFDGQTGTPARWHALAGVWGVGNGMLIGLDDEQESHGVIWAGATPGVLPLDFTAEIDLAVEPPSFSPEPFTGGVVFCATEPVHFEQGPHGYAVTLTPLEPRGERLGLHYLVHGQRETVQEVDLVDGIRPRPGRSPFLRLRVEVAGELIRLLANGEPVIEFADLNFRGGFFGLFTEGGALLRADNVRLPPRRPPCTLAIETFTIKEDPGHIYIQGTGSGGDPCLGPEECGCAEVGVTVEGFKEVRLPGGNPLLARIPVPEGCRPESQREVIARCIEEGTLFGTPEATKFTCPEPPPPVGGNRLPGDCNADGALNISDPICLLGFLFTGSPSRLPCGTGRADDPGNRSLLDHQGDRKIDLSDAVATLNYLFGGAAPPSLGRSCTPIAGCEREACRS